MSNRAPRNPRTVAINASREAARASKRRERGKAGGSRTGLGSPGLTAGTCASLSVLMFVRAALAGPTGGQVTTGVGSILQNGNNTAINQQSQNLTINWTDFSIGANETVRFNQPNSSAIALNRVLGQNASTILGNLSSDGQVFILNPNGVLFGKSAQVNVGSLVASSLNLSDADLQGGHYQFTGSSSSGAVVNQGQLNAAPGGYVALLGPKVSNYGSIKATTGTVLLASGSKLTLRLDNGSLLSYSIDQGAVDALAENHDLIQANGGRVFMDARGADAVSKAVVNNTGIIEAQTVDNHGGVIRLLADANVGQVNVGGTLDASAPGTGDGGQIETSAAHVKVADDARVTTAAAQGKTGGWLVDPNDYTIAASGGDISGSTLSAQLGSTSVTLASTNGATSGNGDIFVNDAVSWSANTTLTLNATRNIQINSNITASGNSAGLTLNYGSSGNYFVNGAKVTLSGSAPVLKIGGTTYTVINSLGVVGDTSGTTLQGMQGNLAGNYALGSDIDASATSGWTSIQGIKGFKSIASNGSSVPSTLFTGTFAGLGHVISNMTMTAQNNNYVGLFGETGTAAVIRDVGMTGSATILGNDFTGALVGYNQGTILNSYSTFNVQDQHYLGGLVGQNSGTISGSYATGNVVSQNKLAGGLVGYNLAAGIITGSYATGTVTGVNKMIGGLVGENDGQINTSYATGTVGGATAQLGGLVGLNASGATITNSYAIGTVSVGSTAKQIGGLAGENDGTVTKSFAAGVVKGTTSQAGGLIGFQNGGTVNTSFWDTSTSGQSSSAAGTGMTTAQMQAQTNFTSATSANGSANPAWDFGATWQMYNGLTYPLLKGFLKPITISAANISATYTASAWSGTDTYTCSISCSGAGLLGTLTVTGPSNAVNVGTYSITPSGLYSNQQGYAITYAPGTLTITPASLVISGLTASNKVYDGTLTDTLSGSATYHALGSDAGNLTLSGTAVGSFGSKNVGTNKAVTLSGLTLTGSAAGNYTLVAPSSLSASITPATLTITGVTANNKIYDATTTDSLSGTAKVTPINGDSVSVTGSGTGLFATKNVGNGRTVTVSGFTLSGADAGNYTLVQPTLSANITPASLFVTGVTASNKVYDATTSDSLGGTASVAAINGDSVTVGGTGTGVFATKNVGNARAVTVTGFTLSGADAGNYTLVQPTGLTANITPATLFVTGVTASNKVYDATTTDSLSGTASVAGLNGDSVSVTGTGTGVFSTKNVGNGRGVTVSGYTLAGADASNYTLVQPTGLTANITPASLFVTGVSASNKIYDATTTATLTGTATVTGFSGDNVSVGGTGSGVFSTKNVGNGRAVTVSGYTLAGADASNYTLFQPTGLTASITQASLVVTGVTASNKVYDATTTDSLGGTAKVTGFSGDSVSVSGTGVGVFATKNVGNGRAVTVTGYTLSGADASNYTVVQPTGLTASITPASLTVSGVSASSKVYDATTTASLSGTASVAGFTGDSVSVTGTGTGVFSTKNVGNGRTVTVTGYTLAGADASNYTLSQPTGLTANITPASLFVTGVSASNKIYDATTTASLSGTASVTGLSGDNVSIAGTGTGVFLTKNVGNGRTVTVTGYTLTGADASNYTVVQPTGLTANITPLALSVTGLTASNKVYDGTTTATLTGSAAISALNGDNVSLGGAAAATFASKNVGTGKAVTVTGYSINGADASNYSLIQPTGLTANITPASVMVGGLSALNKVYDSTTTASLSGTATVSGIGNDNISVAGTGSAVFVSKNVGTGRAVTVTGYTLTGADASNYTLVQPAGLTANITPAQLLVTGVSASGKVYDATTTATLSGTARVNAFTGDSVSLGGTVAAAFITKNVGIGRSVTVSGYSLSGTDAGNYTLVQPTGLTADITPLGLVINGLTANSKVYDATTTAVLNGTAAVTGLTGDSVSLSGTGVGAFATKDVGTGKTVTVSGYSLTGTDAGNYKLVSPSGLVANITPASLSITGLGASNKVYDATTTATLTGTAAVAGIGSDSVSLAGTGTAVFADKNVGTNKVVTVSGYTLTGADAQDYTLGSVTGLTASITPASLAINGIVVGNKVYDGTTAASFAGTANVVGIGTDSVSLNGTGSAVFADKNVGTGKSVAISGYSLTGADAGNYTLVSSAGLTANITPAPLLVTGLSAIGKVYDATTAAGLSGTAQVSGIKGDAVSVAGSGTATFATKDVGSAKTVSVSGYTLTGADAGNYTLVEPTGLTASITPASLVVSGLTANSKVYDSTTTATLTGTAVVSGLGTDSVAVSGTGVATFADKNVGNNKTISVSGYSLTGADAQDYVLVNQPGLSASITPATLMLGGVAANNKVYDGTTTARLTGSAGVTAFSGDSVSVAGGGAAAFASKNVGSNVPVTLTGYSLAGTDAGNYTLVMPTGLTANISPATLQVSGLGVSNKVYDATTTASLTGTASVSGIGTDSVSLAGTGSATFGSKNVGTGKAITVTGYGLTGADAGNYTLQEPTNLTANITPAPLAVNGLSAVGKVYDATTNAALSGTASVTGITGDTVFLTGGAIGSFADKNVGSNKAVSVSGLALTGTDAGNYTLVAPSNLTASITPATLAIGGVSASNKVYDATTTATLRGSAVVNAFTGDQVTVSGTGVGTFANKNVGVDKAVTVTGYSLTGADAGNYTVVQPAGLLANISPANLVVTGLSAANKVYDATNTASLTGAAAVSGFSGDSVSVSGTGTAFFANKNAGTGKAVTVSGYSLTGADAGNYTVVQPVGLTANITPATLAVTGLTASDKVYDTSTAATLNGAGAIKALLNDNVVLIGTGTGAFADKNAGTNKAVTVTGYSLVGADAGNYVIGAPALTASITPATLTVAGLSANNKVYDTTTTASLSGAATVTALGSDSVTVGGTGTATFANKNAGQDKAVTVAGYTLTGKDAGNYTLVQPTGLTANISQATIALTGIQASDKVYDGTIAAALTGTAGVKGLGNDSVGVTGSGVGAFADKNAGSNKPVTVSGYSLTGQDAGNYTLAMPTNLTANITPRALTVGATASSRTYDGLTDASVSLTDNRVAGDALTVGYGSAAFSDANAATGKTVSVNGISLTGANAANYTVNSTATATADITPAALTITANSISKVYDAVAWLGGNGVTYSGFVNNESASVLSGSIGYVGTAQRSANAGTYTIVPKGLTSTNYSITYVAGTLTINKAPLTVTANDVTKLFDNSPFSGDPNGVTYSGLVAGQGAGVLTGPLQFTGSSQGAVAAGTYSIVPSNLSSPNYAITFVPGTLQINAAAGAKIASVALAGMELTPISQQDTSMDGGTASTVALAP
jgi:filamentous hemagglutinin family protein